GAPRTRVAVVVSRQVSPRASKRNLVKRRLWAGLREHRAALPAQGYHVIVTGQPKLLHLAYAELARELGSFIRRLPKT
ncbi:MAG: ribonuclease P protein component, partial [Candidatus Veblenbacteria bacterium]|nr:ribonuclease P protein component [Candidatus Veblenbacteria bacterium]